MSIDASTPLIEQALAIVARQPVNLPAVVAWIKREPAVLPERKAIALARIKGGRKP